MSIPLGTSADFQRLRIPGSPNRFAEWPSYDEEQIEAVGACCDRAV